TFDMEEGSKDLSTKRRNGATLTKFDESVHGKFQGIADLAAYNCALEPKKKYICSFPGSANVHKKAPAKKAPARAPSDEKPRAKAATETQTPEPKRARRSRKQVRYHSEDDNEDSGSEYENV
ncbi:hypothetical protein THAOC_18820, partial [Thalassiosira oceanica]